MSKRNDVLAQHFPNGKVLELTSLNNVYNYTITAVWAGGSESLGRIVMLGMINGETNDEYNLYYKHDSEMWILKDYDYRGSHTVVNLKLSQ
jgi:hypothetical protein